MPMTKESMANFIHQYLAASTQTSVEGIGTPDNLPLLEALCQGIIDEIKTNAVVTTTSGAPDDEHIGKIE